MKSVLINLEEEEYKILVEFKKKHVFTWKTLLLRVVLLEEELKK